MICPVCKVDMIVVEYHDIELDHCVECHGAWFDSGELDLLLESLGLDIEDLLGEIIRAPETATAEKKRRCPIHGEKMKKTTIGDRPQILIDACPNGDGLWFDGGEVHQLITQLTDTPSEKQSSQEKVEAFLREALQGEDI